MISEALNSSTIFSKSSNFFSLSFETHLNSIPESNRVSLSAKPSIITRFLQNLQAFEDFFHPPLTQHN
ncbi:hypothetical protein, partial [Variovorax ginsengisoli]|uniref:hypothetical protein n=1 Tax=Variovorax ginsengisoli TaxID=363844 RepID=UPI0027D8D383